MPRGGYPDSETARKSGKKGGRSLKERYGRQRFVDLGAMGGAANARNHDRAYFVELGRAGARKRWAAVRAQQAAAKEQAEPKP